jgi:exopolyphosphatase/guanosine-5'-triphosphate,3'-diphosphate pyrophosphatase
MRVGAIDVGSNSIRLLVADVSLEVTQGTGVDTVARAGESCRLARGLDQSGEIDPKIAERAAAVVAEFAGRARSLGSRNIVLAATAALRSARNGDQVAALIGDRSGLRVRVLAGEDEARMVYRAVIGGLGPMASRSACVVFDVGGGSTEVVSGFGLEPGRWVSLPFGAVSLTERLLRTDPPAPAEIAELRSHVSQQLMHECAYLPDRAPLLAGVGGTITLLACLDRGLTAYEPGMVEGHAIPVDRLRERIASLCAMSQARRRELPVMGEGRADIVVAGALIVDEVVRRFPTGSLVCSTRGLRYALARLAAEEAASGGNDGATPPAGEPRS